jgi:hypothetical protein
VQRHQDIQAGYEASAHLGSSKHQLSEYHLRRTFDIVNFLAAIFREYVTFTCLYIIRGFIQHLQCFSDISVVAYICTLDVMFLMNLRMFSCSVICDLRQIILSMGTFGKLISYVRLVAFIMEGFCTSIHLTRICIQKEVE